jgi:endonuclease/exonuclease/phosphatase family metal-dependent hydrolase
MNYRILLFLMAGVAVGCGDDSGSGQPTEVTIETFNLALAGAFIPFEEERRQPLADAIATAEADILCLQEVWTQADKVMIRDAAAAANFPHSVLFEDDLDTELDDETDQNDQVPLAPTTAPCSEGTAEDQMTLAIDCVAEFCNTIAPSDEDGKTTSTACAQDNCLGVVLPLITGEPRCYACVATQLPTSTFAEIRSTCPVVINQDLAFQGQNGVMILSRYLLKDGTDWVIPGTWNRRVIMSATAELPNGSELDVYCNHLTPIFGAGGGIDAVPFPYTGQYGLGETDAGGWEAEQLLQAEKLIDYVEATSGETPAVILGDLNAGHAFPEEVIIARGEPTLNLLEAAFPPAYTEDYAPACTFCDTNPISGVAPGESRWIDHILMYNLTADAVTATKRTFDENVVDVGGDEMVPLSDHFGMQSVIVVP